MVASAHIGDDSHPMTLLTRARKLAGPDRDFDAEIFRATNAYRYVEGHVVPAYTASLDAIVGLIEAKLPEWKWRVSTELNASFDAVAHAEVMDRDWPDPLAGFGQRFDGHAPTPALALCCAFLAALNPQETTS